MKLISAESRIPTCYTEIDLCTQAALYKEVGKVSSHAIR